MLGLWSGPWLVSLGLAVRYTAAIHYGCTVFGIGAVVAGAEDGSCPMKEDLSGRAVFTNSLPSLSFRAWSVL